MKFGLKEFSNYKATPARLHKLGDALIAASTFATSAAILADYRVLSIFCVFMGMAGKFLINFFSEDER